MLQGIPLGDYTIRILGDIPLGIRPRWPGFRKSMSCLTNLISSYDQVAHPVDVDVVHPDFSEAIDTAVLEKLAAHDLDMFY